MLVTMSDKDLSRYKVINDVCERRLRLADAAEPLNLSERQVQQLIIRVVQQDALFGRIGIEVSRLQISSMKTQDVDIRI
ncbi:hypothetical protein [Vibrio sonorensis]|uniref:hypothetical protein n=1 Tax=Vibrio sonorensis TaxID=1004316 RepID=UPI0008DABE18|nr:hypothetical protein [Vibrio sonorensis]